MNFRHSPILIFLCIINFITAQESSNQYIPNNLDSLKVYLKRINNNHIEKINGSLSSKIKKAYKNRDGKVLESIEDSTYIFNSKIKKDLNLVLEHIYESNPNINPTDFSFFIKNSIVPNAACYGDGMFEINLGLFTQLESNDELAFIICHEIAHKLLEHSLKGITKRVALINSKETKKKVREIKRKRYGQTRAALSVIDELSIDILDYSKEVEAEADSLGFVMFSKTRYSKPAALYALEKLKRVDEMVFHHDIKIDSVFDFKSYPFKSYWLKETTSLFDTSEKINDFSLVSDTLKTHPEIEFRVNKLIKDYNVIREENKLKTIDYKYQDLKHVSNMQSIQFAFDLKFLDLALYQLIEKYNHKKISSEYYYSKMVELLYLTYQAKKAHELGKYVPQKNGFSDEKQLNTIRLFLNNLELNEVKKIGLAFCELIKNKKIDTHNLSEIIEFFKSINN
ncbi:M48 family metalloprotease [Flavivirga aquimarina]|uniref:M48 family metalloprotease n=1 Tax=Flavivirga aquimarina TaxID=2027862 RepID=A0ABT8WGP8_9FLAO|nr:M48 family metalloprotease [Flavivirga aquimarina]MDO5972288.1 M48 family metalloprotease [Flavivirga aquimarina]